MSTDNNKAVYWRYIQEVFNEGRLDRLNELLAPDYTYHEAPPGTPAGAEGIRQVVTQFRGAFPDLKITIEEQIAEGDRVCSRATTRGTHKGPLFGIPATGKSVTMTGITWVRVVDGKITDSWVKNDVFGLMSQLGVIPPKK
jgi:steroid delta-isomerase-like uncharacterized protein